ncbi:G3E family GTPase [Sporosarcina luteola]|nr:G3E family GTPase [Sporosarcina luteola]
MIEVYLFSGFLGSGKTSLLLHAIQELKQQGKQPAVLMNEFGSLGFDSDQVDQKGDIPLKELLSGCICCTGSEKTEAQLQGLLEDYEHIDIILIETSGAAHPVEALDAVYSPLFADKLQIKGIITVADVKRWMERESLSPRIRSLFIEQIRHASLILANKADLITDSELANVTVELSQLNGTAQIIQTIHAKIPFAFIETSLNTVRFQQTTDIVSGKGVPLSSKLITFKEPVDQTEFEKWVRSLPETVYRMKGYVPIKGYNHPYLFQYAYGLVHWLPEYVKVEPRVVVIGEDIQQIEYRPPYA